MKSKYQDRWIAKKSIRQIICLYAERTGRSSIGMPSRQADHLFVCRAGRHIICRYSERTGRSSIGMPSRQADHLSACRASRDISLPNITEKCTLSAFLTGLQNQKTGMDFMQHAYSANSPTLTIGSLLNLLAISIVACHQ